MVVRPLFAWHRGLLPYLLYFALQQALDVQVPVGSLLPYGLLPSQWGHPCGVEAGEVLDRNEGIVCSFFHFGLILHDEVTLWVETVFDFILDWNEDFFRNLSFGWFRAFTVASPFRGSSLQCGLTHLIATEASFLIHMPNILRNEVTLWVNCDRFPLDHE